MRVIGSRNEACYLLMVTGIVGSVAAEREYQDLQEDSGKITWHLEGKFRTRISDHSAVSGHSVMVMAESPSYVTESKAGNAKVESSSVLAGNSPVGELSSSYPYASSYHSCTTWSTIANSSSMACSDTVDFPFYVPSGSSVELMSEIASERLHDIASAYTLLSSECLRAAKAAACATVFLRCRKGGRNTTWTATATGTEVRNYNTVFRTQDVYPSSWESVLIAQSKAVTESFPPFQRPCESVCTNVTAQCGVSLLLNMNSSSVAIDATRAWWGGGRDIPWLYCSSARMNYSSLSWYFSADGDDGHQQLQYSTLSSYPIPYLYDQSNNASICTVASEQLGWSSSDMSGSNAYADIEQLGTYEPYLYKNDPHGACTGIVSDLYVPYRQRMLDGRLLAPMRERYAVQRAVEAELRGVLSSLPGWLSGECRWQLRRYLCGSQLLGAHRWTLSSVLDDTASIHGGLNASMLLQVWATEFNISTAEGLTFLHRGLYAPSYPHRSVCESYWSSCGSFLDRLKSMETHRSVYNKLSSWSCNSTVSVPAYSGAGSPSRSSSSSDGGDTEESLLTVLRFPLNNQSVLNLHMAGYDGDVLTVSSSPNKLESSSDYVFEKDSSYSAQCPLPGFVVPDDHYHPRNKWIPGTGCTEACRLDLFTEDQLQVLYALGKAFSLVSMTVALLVAAYWLSDKNRRREYYLLSSFIICVVLMTIEPLMSAFGGTMNHTLCLNNAVPRRQTDGPSMCVAEGSVLMVAFLALNYAWLLQSRRLYIQFYTTIKLRHRKGSSYVSRLELLIIFGLPLISFIIAWSQKYFGFSNKDQTWCLLHSDTPPIANVLLSLLPLAVCFIAGTYFTLMVVGKVIYLVYFGPASRRGRRRVGVQPGALSSGRSPLVGSARGLLAFIGADGAGADLSAALAAVPAVGSGVAPPAGTSNRRLLLNPFPGAVAAYPPVADMGTSVGNEGNQRAAPSGTQGTVEYNDQRVRTPRQSIGGPQIADQTVNDRLQLRRGASAQNRDSGSLSTDNGGLAAQIGMSVDIPATADHALRLTAGPTIATIPSATATARRQRGRRSRQLLRSSPHRQSGNRASRGQAPASSLMFPQEDSPRLEASQGQNQLQTVTGPHNGVHIIRLGGAVSQDEGINSSKKRGMHPISFVRRMFFPARSGDRSSSSGGGRRNSRNSASRAAVSLQSGNVNYNSGQEQEPGQGLDTEGGRSHAHVAALLRANTSILVFTLAHVVMMTFIFLYRIIAVFNKSKADRSYEEWRECAFVNFDVHQPNDWMIACGRLPKYQVTFGLTVMMTVGYCCYGVIVSFMHFSSMVRQIFNRDNMLDILDCIFVFADFMGCGCLLEVLGLDDDDDYHSSAPLGVTRSRML